MLSEHDKLARDAAASNQTFEDYLLRLTGAGTGGTARLPCLDGTHQRTPASQCSRNWTAATISRLCPRSTSRRFLELARCEWIRQQANCCLVGSVGTGQKHHLAISRVWPPAVKSLRVRYFTAAALVNALEEKQKQYQLDRLLGQLDHVELLICDELGHRTFSRGGAELLFQVFADRYERRSLLLTSSTGLQRLGPGLSS